MLCFCTVLCAVYKCHCCQRFAALSTRAKATIVVTVAIVAIFAIVEIIILSIYAVVSRLQNSIFHREFEKGRAYIEKKS